MSEPTIRITKPTQEDTAAALGSDFYKGYLAGAKRARRAALDEAIAAVANGCLGTRPPYHASCSPGCHTFDRDALTRLRDGTGVERPKAVESGDALYMDLDLDASEWFVLPEGWTIVSTTAYGDPPRTHLTLRKVVP